MKMKSLKLLSLGIISSLILTPTNIFASELPVRISAFSIEAQSNITPRADDIRYVYQVRHGTLYKRLYNFSKGIWIGDWIAC